MAVQVSSYEGNAIYEEGVSWNIVVEDNFVLTYVYDNNSNEIAVHFDAKNVKHVATPLQDQLKEALDLLQSVDDGNYRNQTDEWSDRTENLLGSVKND